MIDVQAPHPPANFDVIIRAREEVEKALKSVVAQMPVVAAMENQETQAILTAIKRDQEQRESIARNLESLMRPFGTLDAYFSEQARVLEQMALVTVTKVDSLREQMSAVLGAESFKLPRQMVAELGAASLSRTQQLAAVIGAGSLTKTLLCAVPPVFNVYEEMRDAWGHEADRINPVWGRIMREIQLSSTASCLRERPLPREKEIIREFKTNNYVYFVPWSLGIEPERFETTKQNLFMKRGEAWLLGIDGDLLPARHQKGLEYIAYALARPGQSLIHINVFDDLSGQEEFESTLEAEPLADKETIREVRARYAKLKDDLESAEEDGLADLADKYRDEMRILGEYLSSRLGLGGHLRVNSDRDRRAKDSVNRAIKRALGDLKSAHLPLHAHLMKHLQLTPLLTYQPDTPVDWEF